MNPKKWLLAAVAVLTFGSVSALEYHMETTPNNPRVSQRVVLKVFPQVPPQTPDYEKILEEEYEKLDAADWQIKVNGKDTLPFSPSGGVVGTWSFTPQEPGSYTLFFRPSGANDFKTLTVNVDAALSLRDATESLTQNDYTQIKGGPPTNVSPGSLPTVNADDVDETAIVRLLKRLSNILVYAAGAIAIVLIIFAAVRMVLAFGDPEGVTAARQSVWGVVLGLVVIMSSYVVVRTALNLVFIGDTVPDPATEIAQCQGETATRLAAADAILSEARSEIAIAQASMGTMNRWKGFANELQGNFALISWYEPTAKSDLSRAVAEVNQSVTQSQLGLEIVRQQVDQMTATHDSILAQCALFSQEDLLLPRAQSFENDVKQSSLVADATDAKNKVGTEETVLLDQIEKIVGGDCDLSAPDKSTGGLIYTVTNDDQVRYSCVDDWDGDGIPNDRELELGTSPTNPLDGAAGLVKPE